MLLYICQDGERASGVATYGYELLRRTDARMLLLNAARPPRSAPPEVHDRITVVDEAASHDPARVAAVLQLLVSNAGDRVTILPNTGDTPWSATATLLSGLGRPESVRVLGIVHSDTTTQYSLARQYASIAPVWIGVSRQCARTLEATLAGTPASVHELPYPIVPCPPGARPVDGPVRLAYVGRLEESQKRVSRLPAVLRALERRALDFRATIVGDGPAAADLERTLDGLGPAMRSRVTLRRSATRTDIDGVWRDHHIALLVSAYEGLPLALLEAMAAGVCPVVMAIDSGLDELVDDGRSGVIVPQGDVDEMARAIEQLAERRVELERFGAAARARVTEQFSPAVHFPRLRAIVDELWQTPAPDASRLPADETSAALAATVERLRTVDRPVAIFGAGMFGRKLVDRCAEAGIEVAALFDSDRGREHSVYRGLECRAPEEVTGWPEVQFVAGSLEYGDDISQRIADEFAAVRRPAPSVLVARR